MWNSGWSGESVTPPSLVVGTQRPLTLVTFGSLAMRIMMYSFASVNESPCSNIIIAVTGG